MSLEEQMAADAAKEEAATESAEMPENTALEQVRDLAIRQMQWEDYMFKLEAKLVEAKKEWRDIAEKELPNKMMECGISNYTLVDGSKISMKQEYYASIPKDNPDPAFMWLREHNLDGIIKNEVTVGFSKGEDALASEFAQWVAEKGLRPEQKTTIHAMTLKAFVKEQMEKGVDIPVEAFGVYTVTRSKVELPKVKK
jgi:hypothetical protein